MVNRDRLSSIIQNRLGVVVTSKDEWYALMEACQDVGANWRSGTDALHPSDMNQQMDMINMNGQMLVCFGYSRIEANTVMTRSEHIDGKKYVLFDDLVEKETFSSEDLRNDLLTMFD